MEKCCPITKASAEIAVVVIHDPYKNFFMMNVFATYWKTVIFWKVSICCKTFHFWQLWRFVPKTIEVILNFLQVCTVTPSLIWLQIYCMSLIMHGFPRALRGGNLFHSEDFFLLMQRWSKSLPQQEILCAGRNPVMLKQKLTHLNESVLCLPQIDLRDDPKTIAKLNDMKEKPIATEQGQKLAKEVRMLVRRKSGSVAAEKSFAFLL